MIKRVWLAECDHPGCDIQEIFLGSQVDGRWQLGIRISDLGWQASSGEKDTYCPKHRTRPDEYAS